MTHEDLCPHCKFNLDGGDIYQALKKEFPNSSKANLIEKAHVYGWTEQKKLRFSKRVDVYSYAHDKTIGQECPICGGNLTLT